MNRNDEILRRRPTPVDQQEELRFYLTSSDRDLLNKVEEIMGRQGVLGLRDASGRIHYVIDGRRGSPFAARRVSEVATRLYDSRAAHVNELDDATWRAIDEVLAKYPFQHTLRGYRFLRQLLFLAVGDPSTLHPISKRLYPLTSRHFRVSPSQIERNVRYLLDRLAEDGGVVPVDAGPLVNGDGQRLSVTASLYTLYDQVLAVLRRHKKSSTR